jgi:hypothetical protein
MRKRKDEAGGFRYGLDPISQATWQQVVWVQGTRLQLLTTVHH